MLGRAIHSVRFIALAFIASTVVTLPVQASSFVKPESVLTADTGSGCVATTTQSRRPGAESVRRNAYYRLFGAGLVKSSGPIAASCTHTLESGLEDIAGQLQPLRDLPPPPTR